MKAGTIVLAVYIAVLLAALVLGPLVVLHGYRAWWLDIFYAGAFSAYIGGIISHSSMARRRTRKALP